MFGKNIQDVTSFFCTFDNSSCSDAVADVHDFNVLVFEGFADGIQDWCVGAHAQADKTIVEWHFFFFAFRCSNKEGIRSDFQKCSIGALFHVMFFH